MHSGRIVLLAIAGCGQVFSAVQEQNQNVLHLRGLYRLQICLRLFLLGAKFGLL